jgi:hypothetical protein
MTEEYDFELDVVVCLIHGEELHYDMRSGFMLCTKCEDEYYQQKDIKAADE